MIKLTVDCRGQPAQVVVAGDGPDVIMTGTAAPLAWSVDAVDSLAARGHRVINFDYTPPDGWTGETIARTALDQVEDVVSVMTAVGSARAAVVGPSRGGMTAFGLAARQPELVSALILAMPVAGFSDTIRVHTPDPEPEDGEDPDDFMRRVLLGVFSEEFVARNPEKARSLIELPAGTVERLDRLDEEAFSDADDVTCPTLIIEGERDLLISAEHPRRYLEAIPDAEHVVIPGASHGWILEDPEGFADVVAGFLLRTQG